MSRPHLPFAILSPVDSAPRLDDLSLLNPTCREEMVSIWEDFEPAVSVAMACDIETKGNLAHDLECVVTQMSFSDARGSICIDFRESYPDCYKDVLAGLIESQVPLVFHNGLYDLGFLYRDANSIVPGVGMGGSEDIFSIADGAWPNFTFDTYSLYRHLANESWPGQRWGLKEAQVDLLGWDIRGDEEMMEWLEANGFGKGKKAKGEMWRVPTEISSRYCALDSDSTWQLLTKVLLPAAHRFKAVLPYQDYFLNLVRLLVVQQLTGIRIDKDKLETYNQHLIKSIGETKQAFLTHEEVAPHVEFYINEIMEAHSATEPEKFKQVKVPDEPPKYNQNGTVSKRWESWQSKWSTYEPEISYRWECWDKRRVELEQTELFNMNSGDTKRWLFYTRLGFPVLMYTDSETNPQPSTDADAARFWGEPGKVLTKYSELVKEQGYVEKCLEMIRPTRLGTWRLHTQWKAPGTTTCRLAGAGGLNLQQVPKTKGYLECFIPDDGCIWVDCDVASLEPHVLAEASRDSTLMEVYGPQAKPFNDIYMFVGSKIDGFRAPLLEAGYNPESPTEEGTSAAKKQCKGLRSIIKTLHLGASYGAGAAKIRQALALDGIDKSFEEVKAIHTSYWEAFKGVKQYEKFLQTVWEKTGGYTLNPLGHPVCIHETYIKDATNRNIQSAGHAILVIQITLLAEELSNQGIRFLPIIADFHDQSIIQVRLGEEHRTKEVFTTSYYRLNTEILNGAVKIKGDPQIVNNLADAKVEQ